MRWTQNVAGQGPRWFLSLGQIFGCADFDMSVDDLSWFPTTFQADDRLLLGIDGETNGDVLLRSYRGPEGCFERFIRHGFENSNRILGHVWYRAGDWEYCNDLRTSPEVSHSAFLRAKCSVDCPALKLHIVEGDEIRWIITYKRTPEEMRRIFDAAGLQERDSWKSPSGPVCK
jgi:uncharacterized SAM-dependent methyltransferase